MKNYLLNILMALTCLFNSIRGNPWHCPTCATEYENKRNGKWNAVALLDSVIGKGHCMEAWINYQLRKKVIK